ncbi:hypothetical protein SPLC1_S360740 [Arthrospira platensis C1]|nr:hypothetical protein SPLC1_S360740 [Arthrospira platensis C1]
MTTEYGSTTNLDFTETAPVIAKPNGSMNSDRSTHAAS